MTQTQLIYRDLLDRIVSGELEPGALLQEQKLADQYGTSKMPVRDALHLLCRQDYLTSRPRRGYEVTRMTRRDFDDLLQARRPLELLALDLAIVRASDEELTELLAIAEQTDGEEDRSYHSNRLFHLRLFQLSGNPYLYRIAERLMTEISRAGCSFCRRDTALERRAHIAIARAMGERDRIKARRCLLKDISGEY